MPDHDRTARWRLVVAAVALVGATACGDDSGTATESTAVAGDPPVTTATTEPAAPTTTEAAAGASPYTVTLEDPGQEPRRELRLRAEPGDTDAVTQRQEMTMEVSAGGQVQSAPSPVTELDFTNTIEDVNDDRITAVGTYDDVRVLDTPGADPATTSQVRELLQEFLSATTHATYTNRGAILDARIDGLELPGAGGAPGPLLEQMAASLTDSAEAMSTPFPAEPVGPGARWRVDSELTLTGMPVEITTLITLTELTEDRAAGTIEQTMRFVPGDVDLFGTQATIVSGELSGGGSIEWDLVDGLLPRSDVSISGTNVIEIDGTRIEQRQDQRVTIVAR